MNTKERYGLFVAIVALIIIGAALSLSGCQTAGGAFRDLESLGRYGRQHTITDSHD